MSGATRGRRFALWEQWAASVTLSDLLFKWRLWGIYRIVSLLEDVVVLDKHRYAPHSCWPLPCRDWPAQERDLQQQLYVSCFTFAMKINWFWWAGWAMRRVHFCLCSLVEICTSSFWCFVFKPTEFGSMLLRFWMFLPLCWELLKVYVWHAHNCGL